MLSVLFLSMIGHPSSACLCCALLPQERTPGGWPKFQPDSAPIALNSEEINFKGVRQLTFGGQNAEAYWRQDGKKIIFQSRQEGYPDEQIFTMNADGSQKTLVSTGKGRCTCGYWSPDGKKIFFSSTHAKNEGAQPPVDMSKGYVWMVNPQFSLYTANADGSGKKVLVDKNQYVAETTVSPDGKWLYFTGGFDGDLEIYRAKIDGSGIQRMTNEVGYDGGPFVSWDGKKIAYRRAGLASEEAKNDYLELFKQHLVRPSKLEIWVMDADGNNRRQVTSLNSASFAPFIHPDGKRIIFSSNYGDPKGREFNLFMIDIDGKNLRQITLTPEFDGFPMFTKDGKRLVWASNRNGTVRGETNIFVADWVD